MIAEHTNEIPDAVDAAFRRGYQRGVAMLQVLHRAKWEQADIDLWIEKIGQWRHDPTAANLPPQPVKTGGQR